ncbi:hypothetical protein J6590_103217 [Homalodisca vitripennis]|nr:hypothetical protein J6590_103217 [Homalodisca vitripennis]
MNVVSNWTESAIQKSSSPHHTLYRQLLAVNSGCVGRSHRAERTLQGSAAEILMGKRLLRAHGSWLTVTHRYSEFGNRLRPLVWPWNALRCDTN